MNIQSLSVVVPTKNKCVNNCKFCVSRTHTNPYCDRISQVVSHYHLQPITIKDTIEYRDYFNRLQYARDNGCNVAILTGTGEPIQNPKFIDFFFKINSTLSTPFKSVEIQTTGVLLDEDVISHLRQIGVTTISFSISNIFDNDRNLDIIGCHPNLRFDLVETIKLVKKYDFNLRLSLNLIIDYDNYMVDQVIDRCKELGADQVTFRKLYKSDLNNEIDKWIENNASEIFYGDLIKYVKSNGKFLGVLPFGPSIYNIEEMAIVVDDNCMSVLMSDINNVVDVPRDTYKYLILRENAKLYSHWETKSSLIF